MLPPAQQARAVAHLGVAADGTDAGVTQRLHQVPDGVGLEDGVAVEHHEDVVAGLLPPDGKGSRLPPVRLAYQPDVWQPEGLDEVAGPVGGPVVEDDDLELGVVARDQGVFRTLDNNRFVVGGYQDGDRWEPPRPLDAGGRQPDVPARQPDHEQ